MSELTILQLLAAITGMAVGTIPVGIWFLVVELRAIRKVLQARVEDEYQRALALREARRPVKKQEVNVQVLILEFLDQKRRSTPATSEPPVQKQEAPSSSQAPH